MDNTDYRISNIELCLRSVFNLKQCGVCGAWEKEKFINSKGECFNCEADYNDQMREAVEE